MISHELIYTKPLVPIIPLGPIGIDSVMRSLIKFEKDGFKAFVEKDERQGHSYKMDSGRPEFVIPDSYKGISPTNENGTDLFYQAG